MFRLIKFIIKLILILILLGGLVLLYARYLEPHMLITEDVTVHSPHLTAAAEDLNIVTFADTHFSEYYTTEQFQKVVDDINAQDPDLVFFLGDLVDNYSTYDGDAALISSMLNEIHAEYGKFAVYGNHDYGGGMQRHYEEIMQAGGFQVLVNEYQPLDELGIGIVGIDDVVLGYGNPEFASLGREDYYNIVLTHAPDIADQMLQYNVDLILSAHTHGRQVNISFLDKWLDPYILPPYGKKYVKGSYEISNDRGTLIYVTRGIGTTSKPIRLNSPPELTHMTLKIKP